MAASKANRLNKSTDVVVRDSRDSRTAATKNARRSYTDAETELGLRAVALASGDTRKASRALKSQDLPIPESTLRYWAKTKHADRYLAVQNELQPAIYAHIAETSEAIANDLAEIEKDLAAQLKGQVADLAPRDTAGALRNVSVAKAVNIDKASGIRERPVRESERRDALQLLRALATKFPSVIDGNAIEQNPPGELRRGLTAAE